MGSVVRLKDIYPFRVDDLAQVLSERKYSFVVYQVCRLPSSFYTQAIQKPAYKTYNIRGWLQNDLQNNYRTPFYELRAAIQNNPLVNIENATEVLEAVGDGGKVLVVQDDDQISRVARQQCKLVFMNVSRPPQFPTKL